MQDDLKLPNHFQSLVLHTKVCKVEVIPVMEVVMADYIYVPPTIILWVTLIVYDDEEVLAIYIA